MELPNLSEIQDTLSQLQGRLEEKDIRNFFPRNSFPGISINGMVNNIQRILSTDQDQTEKLFLLLPYLTCYHQQLINLKDKLTKKKIRLSPSKKFPKWLDVPNQIIKLNSLFRSF